MGLGCTFKCPPGQSQVFKSQVGVHTPTLARKKHIYILLDLKELINYRDQAGYQYSFNLVSEEDTDRC